MIFAGLVTGTALITSATLIVGSYGVAKNNTALRLRDASRLLASELDADELSAIRDPSQQDSEPYQRIHDKLVQSVSKIQGVRFIYTLRKIPGLNEFGSPRYVFVVDGLPFDDEDFAPTGTELTTSESTDALHRVWQSGKLVVDQDFVTDEWGTWLSGYIPIKNKSGSFETILGIDISASDVYESRARIIRTLTGGYLISILLIIPSAAFFGSRIGGPLRRINDRLLTISQLRFDSNPDTPIGAGWVHEIHEIGQSLSRVEGALQDFNRYVPSKLVRKLVLEKSNIELDGEMRQLAIMFTDIIGFVSITEKLSAHEILAYLNQYFSIVNQAAETTGGILDKYMGDSALIFWGAPDTIASPARCCVETALLCRKQLETLNQSWKSEGIGLQFDTCIGIDYGEVLIGNMGAKQRVNYTILGDRVNLASRIEGINRRYGTRILATRALIESLGEDASRFLIVKVDKTKLRGISQPMELFEIRGHRDSASQQELDFVNTYTLARNLLEEGDQRGALAALEELPDSYRSLAFVRQLLKQCAVQDGSSAPSTTC